MGKNKIVIEQKARARQTTISTNASYLAAATELRSDWFFPTGPISVSDRQSPGYKLRLTGAIIINFCMAIVFLIAIELFFFW